MAVPTDEPQAHRRPSPDPRSEQVAAVYAKAFLGAATKVGKAESLLEELDSLVADVLDAYPAWERVLASGFIDVEEKAAMLDRTLGGQASPLFLNCLKVLSQHGRLDCLRAIQHVAHALYDEQQGRIPVYVRTAVPLAAGLAEKITQALRGMIAREPELVVQHDPGLIGGLVLRVGDTVFDGSVWSQLEQVRAQMIDRSVHEIQSRRDRFRHSGGD